MEMRRGRGRTVLWGIKGRRSRAIVLFLPSFSFPFSSSQHCDITYHTNSINTNTNTYTFSKSSDFSPTFNMEPWYEHDPRPVPLFLNPLLRLGTLLSREITGEMDGMLTSVWKIVLAQPAVPTATAPRARAAPYVLSRHSNPGAD